MNRISRQPAAFSKVSAKSQTVIPREVRKRLKLKPGDTLRYRVTDDGVLLDKATEAGDGRSQHFRNGHPRRTRRPMADCNS
jgi:antitoxin PrlF